MSREDDIIERLDDVIALLERIASAVEPKPEMCRSGCGFPVHRGFCGDMARTREDMLRRKAYTR
jgi:hypothetical protein